jgi:hypothetical protein
MLYCLIYLMLSSITSFVLRVSVYEDILEMFVFLHNPQSATSPCLGKNCYSQTYKSSIFWIGDDSLPILLSMMILFFFCSIMSFFVFSRFSMSLSSFHIFFAKCCLSSFILACCHRLSSVILKVFLP